MNAAVAAATITTGDTLMADPGVYLEKLTAFSRMLRLEGLIVSPQETADAARVLTVLGFSDREQVKTALRTVFAKSREDQAVFDRVFDGFFISEAEMRRQAEEHMRREQELEALRKQLAEAVEKQEFETCASLRDRIRELEG